MIPKASSDDIHLYIIGGYCDLTKQESSTIIINGRRSRYQEAVFWEDPESAVPRLTNLIHDTYTKINKEHITPIFCTIPPGFLNTWNTKRLAQHKTSHLKHTDKYKTMNKHLMDSCIRINQEIIRFNIQHNAHTPKLANAVIQKQGKNKGYKIREYALEDGVHASEKTKIAWAGMILDAIRRNRTGSSAGGLPPQVNILAQADSGSESDQGQPRKRKKINNEGKF